MSRRRTKRARKYISKDEIIASLVGDYLLPRDLRDKLRAEDVPAKRICRMITPDHNHLHALGGADTWGNLTIRLRGPALKRKDNRDTSTVYKSDRLVEGQREHRAAMARKLIGPSPFEDRPKSRIPSRGFAKGHRPLRSRNNFQRGWQP